MKSISVSDLMIDAYFETYSIACDKLGHKMDNWEHRVFDEWYEKNKNRILLLMILKPITAKISSSPMELYQAVCGLSIPYYVQWCKLSYRIDSLIYNEIIELNLN